MASMADAVFDAALSYIQTNTDKLHVCSSEPANFAGVAGVSLGNKATPTVGSPGDRTGGGRKVTFSAITDGTITASGTAAYVAVVDEGGSLLLFTKALDSTQAVTNGNPFTLNSFDVGFPDPS